MDLTGYLILLQVHMDNLNKRMSDTIKSAEAYPEGETPFTYEWSGTMGDPIDAKNNKNNEAGT